MQSSNLTRALLGTLADAYPCAMNVKVLAGEVRCEPEALCKHLWLLHDLGAVRAQTQGGHFESASITDAGLALVRRHADSSDHRPIHEMRH